MRVIYLPSFSRIEWRQNDNTGWMDKWHSNHVPNTIWIFGGNTLTKWFPSNLILLVHNRFGRMKSSIHGTHKWHEKRMWIKAPVNGKLNEKKISVFVTSRVGANKRKKKQNLKTIFFKFYFSSVFVFYSIYIIIYILCYRWFPLSESIIRMKIDSLFM